MTMYGAFGRKSSQSTSAGREHEQRPPAAVAVVDEQREQQRDPGEEQVPDQEPEVERVVVVLADELEPQAQRRGDAQPGEHDEALVGEPAGANTHGYRVIAAL